MLFLTASCCSLPPLLPSTAPCCSLIALCCPHLSLLLCPALCCPLMIFTPTAVVCGSLMPPAASSWSLLPSAALFFIVHCSTLFCPVGPFPPTDSSLLPPAVASLRLLLSQSNSLPKRSLSVTYQGPHQEVCGFFFPTFLHLKGIEFCKFFYIEESI